MRCKLRMVAAIALGLGFPVSQGRAALGIIMPVYTETSAQFNAAYAAAAKVPFIGIINPDDGPGGSKVSSLGTFSNGVRSRGGEVIGYVNSFYGGLSWDEAEEQMGLYIGWYGVAGFFIDEVATNKSSYYNTMKGRASGKYFVLNPGTNISGHTSISRIIVTYENPLSGDQSSPFLSYSNNLRTSGTQSGAIIYSTSSAASMRQCVDRALAQGYDWIYVTNDGGANPYDVVPSYWTDEIDYIARANLPPPVPEERFYLSSSPVEAGLSLTLPTAIGRTYRVEVTTDLTAWSPAIREDNSSAEFIATTSNTALIVKHPATATRAYYRATDITP